MKVLIIEDDEQVNKYIKKGLEESGLTVDVAFDGEDGLYMSTHEHYDVIILDRMLPKLDGLTLLERFRGQGFKTPVIILSALGDVDDKVKGLRAGGDDYLVKPFAFEELSARIEVLARRQNPISHPEVTKLVAEKAELEMDLLARKVLSKGNTVQLQTREFALLEYLMRHKGQVVTRSMLLEKVWNYYFDPQTNVIDVHISRLRKKIDDHNSEVIKTVRGAGYILEDG